MFNKFLTLIIFSLLIISTSCSVSKKTEKQGTFINIDDKTIPLTIGTYTKETSEGIYQADFNSKTGAITNLDFIVNAEQASFISVTKDREKIYAVSEIDTGKLSVFNKDNNGRYQLQQEVETGGSTTCHVTLNNDETLVSVANYRQGSIVVYKVENDRLIKLSSFKHQGSSVHFRQKVPHPHSTYFSKDEKYIYVPDLGTDEIISYPIKEGLPTAGKIALKMNPGDGPRHMAKHPTKELWYVVGEISSVVWVLKPKEDGTFSVVDKQNLLPEGIEGRSTAADIHVSPDGKYLYTSNRGHQNGYHCISVFKVLPSGKLELKGHVTEGINQPRNFTLSPNGQFLLVANQYGNDIIVFKVGKDGMLSLTEHRVEISMPACLKF
ncbi:lactonase family protein [Polaribacter vadi]|uniref:lactonase family protein n=1 Tax=Polaribacter TaxID=52959 RepID=UPI001C095B96|nr:MULTISPECIES: lactonase family protein [Polaribacter]MBU3011308.1 lactonase family protein [Polaribacter vadi]MDO6741120.1 lactonase family protein [Polaribacter sp. 1_MG-2023]